MQGAACQSVCTPVGAKLTGLLSNPRCLEGALKETYTPPKAKAMPKSSFWRKVAEECRRMKGGARRMTKSMIIFQPWDAKYNGAGRIHWAPG